MTELEACVLALLCRNGPMTAYQVRKDFEHSRASTWRASTGAVYPLIRRMQDQGLIAVKTKRGDGRGAKSLVTTAAGRRTVEEWLKETPPWIGDAAEDPIRTRVQFLALLPPASRHTTIARMIEATRAAMSAIDVYVADSDISAVERLAHDGARAMLETRAAWLKKVQKHFDNMTAKK